MEWYFDTPMFLIAKRLFLKIEAAISRRVILGYEQRKLVFWNGWIDPIFKKYRR